MLAETLHRLRGRFAPVTAPGAASGVGRYCLYCRQNVPAWRPYRIRETDRSPFLVRLETIGSNVERFSCPHCRSTDRDRHLHLFFDRLDLWRLFAGGRILHIAPEVGVAERIAARHPELHVRGDLFPTDPSFMKIDLEALPFHDGTFDVVLCNHVLEHVADIRQALKEIGRTMKIGGRLVCQTPFASLLGTTFQEPKLRTPAQRRFFYGQEDHVRLFGTDIAKMIVDAGFTGRLVPHAELLPDIDPERFGINEKEPFFDFVRVAA